MQGYSDVLSSSTLPQQPSLFATAAATVKEKKRLAKLATAREEAPNRFLQVAHLLIKTGAAELSHMGDRWGITPLMLAATIKDVRWKLSLCHSYMMSLATLLYSCFLGTGGLYGDALGCLRRR